MQHSRRGLLKWGSLVFTALSLNTLGSAQGAVWLTDVPRIDRQLLEEQQRVFAHGLASGDPLPDRVILWTRVSPSEGEVPLVSWQVSRDPSFASIEAEGEILTSAAEDFTVKVDALLPEAGTYYYYRFRLGTLWSMVGRTKTAPLTSDRARLALVSCASIWSGYLHAYEMIARRNDLDLVIHCGDYIYDVPDPDEERMMPFDALDRSKPRTLEELRRRYAYYRKNPMLRRAHQQHPWAIVWDNHDISDHLAPREDCVRAFHEWTPTRSPQPQNYHLIYRALGRGALYDIFLLDTRHIGRGEVIEGTQESGLLGEKQRRWLQLEMKSSQARWRLLVNQVMLAPFQLAGRPLSQQQWDGFSEERRILSSFLQREKLENTLILTGDAHMAFASDIEHEKEGVAVEFLPSSVSRGNLDETIASALSGVAAAVFEGLVKAANPHIRYFESRTHGYGLLDLSQERAVLEFWSVDHREAIVREEFKAGFEVLEGTQRLGRRLSTPQPLLGLQARPAPREELFYLPTLELGGGGGDYFDDRERIAMGQTLLAIRLHGRDRLSGITVFYANGLTLVHGRPGGDEETKTLAPEEGEFFRQLNVGLARYKKTTVVSYLRLLTNRGRVIEVGKVSEDQHSWSAPEGRQLAAFCGRQGRLIDRLGAFFEPQSLA